MTCLLLPLPPVVVMTWPTLAPSPSAAAAAAAARQAGGRAGVHATSLRCCHGSDGMHDSVQVPPPPHPPTHPTPHTHLPIDAFKPSDRPSTTHPPVMRPSNTGSLPSRCAGDSVSSVNCCCTSAVARWALAVVEACDTCERSGSAEPGGRCGGGGASGRQAEGGRRHPPSPCLPC